MSVDPGSVELHLALVELYDERGWAALASEKLDRLEELAALLDDPSASALVVTARAQRG